MGRCLGKLKQQNVREVSKHGSFYATLDILLTALPVPRLEYRLQKGASVTRGRGLNLPKVLTCLTKRVFCYFIWQYSHRRPGKIMSTKPGLGTPIEHRSQSSSVPRRLIPVRMHRCMCVRECVYLCEHV